MSKDIRISWDVGLMEGDFIFDDSIQDLESDEGLETAVIISLFTDRRAAIDDILPDPSNPDKRGWWGDLASPYIEGDQIGSKLWLLNREKTLESILVKAKEYAQKALAWLVDDGVAAKVSVETERQGTVGNDRLALKVKIQKYGGNQEVFNFEAQWIAQEARGQ